MAYGKGDKNKLHKAIPVGVGDLTSVKLTDLTLLRSLYLSTANQMATAVFLEEPLAEQPVPNGLSQTLQAIQRDVQDFNKAYAEKARLTVESAVPATVKRYHRQLIGRLAHCSEKIQYSDPQKISTKTAAQPARLYYYVPEDIQAVVTVDELTALEAMVVREKPTAAINFFRRVIVEKDFSGLTVNQVSVIREIHKQAQERYNQPVFGRDEEFVCQIHLDYRVIREKEACARIDGQARILLDSQNGRYYTFLEVSNPRPRGNPIRIPLVLSKNTLKHLTNANVGSLILEIGAHRVQVKAGVAKTPPKVPVLNECEALIGRDFGYTNTVTITAVKRDRVIDPAELELILNFGKDDACQYMGSHYHPMDNVIERFRFSSKRFLDLIAKHSGKIDRLKSQIDLVYTHIHKLKVIIAGHLGIEEHDLIEESFNHKDPLMATLHVRMFRLLAHVKHLKKLRRKLYARIGDIKKSWFGFLSNVELNLAKKLNGAIVREDLSVIAHEKDSHSYKGRTFNRMINNGSKGQYIRRASAKYLWDGIPEIKIPSFYTSCTCPIHNLVDRKMRQGEKFECPQCGKPRHADQNASDTIANYLLLRPALA